MIRHTPAFAGPGPFWCLVLCAGLGAASRAAAAPPTLTSLFPAGAQRGTTVEITAGGTFERWPVQAWVDGKGIELKAAKDKGQLTVSVAADTAPGVYWIRLFDQEGATSLRPLVIGTLPEVPEQEPNDDFKKPQVLASSDVTVNGRLEKPGDVDCFAVKLRKGQTLVAALEANRTLASPMDAVLQVVSADGFVLEQNNDYHGLDPQVVFPIPRDGTYVVRVFAFPAVPDASIRLAGGEQFIYRLTLTRGGFADHAFPLAVSQSEPGPVELVGWNIPEAARKRTVPQGTGMGEVSLGHALLANVVSVRREPHPTIVQSKANDRSRPQSITLPVTVSGCLERAGEHAYQFEAKKGQKLIFQAESQALDFPLNPVLRLTDGLGKSLAQAEGNAPGRDPELTFVVPQDGTYRIELRDLHGDSGPRFLYRLRALLAEPDFELTLASDRFVLRPDKPLDIPVTIDRRNGFKEEIELVAEGLPKGVHVSIVPTGAAAAAKTVTLRLTANSATESAPLRIQGKVKGKDGLTRWAWTAIAGFTTTTPHVWLTVARP